MPWCRTCVADNHRRWRAANVEKARERSRRWRQANIERKKELDRCWREANPDRKKELTRRWRQSNPHKVAAQKSRRAERLARAPGGLFTDRRPDYQARIAYFGGLCAYCRTAPAETLDHTIPVSRGGSNFAANIRPACLKCNLSKGAKKPWEWER